MSQSSQLSNISVSYYGEEMDLESAIDDAFRELQTHMNSTQQYLRSLAMLCDQDGDYKECLALNDHIEDSIDGVNDLFNELRKIVGQISLKPQDAEEKEIYREHKEARKKKKEDEKAEAKAAKEAEKADKAAEKADKHK